MKKSTFHVATLMALLLVAVGAGTVSCISTDFFYNPEDIFYTPESLQDTPETPKEIPDTKKGNDKILEKSGDTTWPLLSKAEIKRMMRETDHSNVPASNVDTGEDYMEQLPRFTSPYSAGKPKNAVLELAVARTNFVRRLAGLNEVVHNEDMSRVAQHGAWVSAKDNKIDHNISAYTRPAGVSDEMWNLANDGVRLANLFRRPRAVQSVDVYMSDNGNPTLGHRFGVLSGIVSRVGFGVASSNTGFGATSMRYNFVKQKDGIVVNDDKPDNWDIVAWPTPGYFPVNTQLFDAYVDQARWSIRFNQKKYKIESDTRVAVTRTGSVTETWSFGAPNNADLRLIGGDTYIFYKGGAKYADGDVFTVRINNIRDVQSNKKINLLYKVQFFDATK